MYSIKDHIKVQIIAKWWLTIAVLLNAISCKKMVEVTPPSNTINSGNVYENDATAISAITNIYADFSKSNLPGGGVTSLSLFPALSADELSLYGGASNNSVFYYYTNALTSANLNNPDFWTVFYKIIFTTNAAIESLETSTGLSALVKQQLLGEAKFIRAFCYFYLVNLYGDVPLALTSDYKINSRLERTLQAAIDQQIINDLTQAKELLSSSFLNGTLMSASQERVRPTNWAASALLARVYLYQEDWSNAETESTAIIDQSALFDTVPIVETFLKNNKEAIWQLQPVNAGWNTEDARTFILPSSGPDASGHPFYLSPSIMNAFEPGDQRRSEWVDSVVLSSIKYFFSNKYKSATFNNPVTEYQVVFRLTEQYLIRAEARAHQNNISGAQDDLNIIRNRAGLSNTGATDQNSLLIAIDHERQTELFTEWGHRWFDMKRRGTVNDIMASVTQQKGGEWNSNWQWYPISRNELQLNNNLQQNAGY